MNYYFDMSDAIGSCYLSNIPGIIGLMVASVLGFIWSLAFLHSVINIIKAFICDSDVLCPKWVHWIIYREYNHKYEGDSSDILMFLVISLVCIIAIGFLWPLILIALFIYLAMRIIRYLVKRTQNSLQVLP